MLSQINKRAIQLSLFAQKYLSTDPLITKILSTALLPFSKASMKHSQFL